MKVTRNKIEVTEEDIQLPLYSCVEVDDFTTQYTRIDESKFSQIELGPLDYKITSFDRKSDTIAGIFVDNMCSKEDYDWALTELVRKIAEL